MAQGTWNAAADKKEATNRLRAQQKDKGRFYPDPDDDANQKVLKFFGRNLLLIGVILALIAVSVYAVHVRQSRQDTLESQEAQILQLKQSVRSTDDEANADYAKTMREATGGVDATHKSRDDAAVEKMLRKALTWDSIDQYLKVRKEIKEQYNFSEDSQFMSTFMPGESQGVASKDASGDMHYSFDKDIQSQYEGMKSVVDGVEGDTYSYFTLVSIKQISDNGTASETNYAALQYTVADGNITNIEAYTAPGGVDRAG